MKVLFLDRDGVINVENMYGYILEKEAFEFYPGVPQAIRELNKCFDKTIIVTNQRCIGKGLITHDGLRDIHEYMLESLEREGASIDRVFYAPDIEDEHPDRKPNIGMGLKAKDQYPEIDFSNSVMVGNNISDMKFGRTLGMINVFISTTSEYQKEIHDEFCDLNFESLKDFADYYRQLP